MTTFLKAAQYQRMVRLSADPHETVTGVARIRDSGGCVARLYEARNVMRVRVP